MLPGLGQPADASRPQTPPILQPLYPEHPNTPLTPKPPNEIDK